MLKTTRRWFLSLASQHLSRLNRPPLFWLARGLPYKIPRWLLKTLDSVNSLAGAQSILQRFLKFRS
jgi:hypothetical protein